MQGDARGSGAEDCTSEAGFLMPLYDLECLTCGAVQEDRQPYNESGRYGLDCIMCEIKTEHRRLPSLFAPYMGEHVFNPEVVGGKFDTMGNGRVQRMPEFRAAKEHDAKLSSAVKDLPPDAPRDQVREAMRSAGPGPSAADWREHLKKPEVKEAKKLAAEQRRNNRLKRARAGAIKRGENINMRRDRLPGDPKLLG